MEDRQKTVRMRNFHSDIQDSGENIEKKPEWCHSKKKYFKLKLLYKIPIIPNPIPYTISNLSDLIDLTQDWGLLLLSLGITTETLIQSITEALTRDIKET